MRLAIDQLWVGDVNYKSDLNQLVDQYNDEIKRRNGFNKSTFPQHTTAILKSGSRLAELAQIKCPVLIVHGYNDPLIRIEHAKKYAALIPQAKTQFFKRMGHDLPTHVIQPIILRILKTMNPKYYPKE